ncbi:DEAD domain containing protein [Amanita muscaria]
MKTRNERREKRQYQGPSTDELLRKQENLKRMRSPHRRIDDEDGGVLRDSTDSSENEAIRRGEDEPDSSQESEDSSGVDVPTVTIATVERVSSESRSTKVIASQDMREVNVPLPSFHTLGISAPLQAALTAMSIKVPTEVQAACIPPLLSGRDCIGNAKTGSGKTIAFALPILQRLSLDPYGIYALVLTPTRELAFQIADQFAVLGSALNVKTAVVVGGMDMMTQALELNTLPHIVIATPGRIVDHLRSSNGEWGLSRVKFLVLDEADRLLTPTFTAELSYLFNILPKDRQTCLFTATLTPSIETLANAPPRPGKQKPFIHRMAESVETVATLRQYYMLVPSHVRESYLYHFLCHPPESTLHLRRAPPEPVKSSRNAEKKSKSKKAADEDDVEQPPPTIIFCARAKTVAYLTLLLKTLHIRSTALHSRLTQKERLSSLSLFRASVVPVLVSTDVGARGLDIEDVAIVINWDLPSEPEEYTHRVGRTARAGRGGVAISFVTERDEEKVLKIEDRIHTKLDELTLREDRVLEKLNAVSVAKRLANMELHDTDFGKRERIQKIKRRRVEGPDSSVDQ